MNKDGYDYSALASPKNIVTRLTPFTFELLSMDDRIKVFQLADEFKPTHQAHEIQAYVPRKDLIAMPYGLPDVSHEISHMVEMNNLKRVTTIDWGFTLFAGRNERPSSSAFFAAFAREIRVRAIQRHMDKNMPGGVAMLRHAVWGEISNRLPYGRFNNNEELKAWVDHIDRSTFNAWSLDRIKTEWTRKLDYIRNWMETP